MSCFVYKYTDKADNIVKYVGIVYSENRSLKDRLNEHKREDWCKNRKWKIEYFSVLNRSIAEAYESHFITYYGTGKYFNKAKAGFGLIDYLPDVNWIELKNNSKTKDYISENYEVLKRNSELKKQVEKLERELKNYINENEKLKKRIELLETKEDIERKKIIKQARMSGINAMPIDKTTGKRKSTKTGRVIGRPCIEYPNGWEQTYKRWKAREIKAVEAMDILNLKKNSFYKLAKKYQINYEVG